MNVTPPEIRVQTAMWEGCDAEDICGWVANQLGFDSHVRSVAISMSRPLTRMVIGHDNLATCVAAISLYIAWHLFNEYSNPAAFIADLTRETGVPEDYIRFRYRYIHCNRMELVTPDMFPHLAGGNMDALNWPSWD